MLESLLERPESAYPSLFTRWGVVESGRRAGTLGGDSFRRASRVPTGRWKRVLQTVRLVRSMNHYAPTELARAWSATILPAGEALIQSRSISTAIERCNNSTDSTSFSSDLILITIPFKPRSGPSSILAALPTRK